MEVHDLLFSQVSSAPHLASSLPNPKRPVATGVNQFSLVFSYYIKPCDWQLKSLRIGATATSGPVFCGCIWFGFGHFFGPINWTYKQYECVIGCLSPYKAHGVDGISNDESIQCADLLILHLGPLYRATFTQPQVHSGP